MPESRATIKGSAMPVEASSMPVADLHCDLLAYLAKRPQRSADDAAARASLPQLRAGGVRTQVLAVFVPTDRQSVLSGQRQIAAYRDLLTQQADRVRPIRGTADLASDRRIGVVPAIENASSFAQEDEPIDDALKRFDQLSGALGPLLYLGLTWADDNRFGGGNRSRKGLSDDGRRLLDHLAAGRETATRGDYRGPAIDFAHASPWLAEGILEHLERIGVALPVLASHACFRRFVDSPRNLSDDLSRTIAERGGVIGLNLMRWWNGGEAPQCFIDQLDHAAALGIGEALCLGADFFCTEDVPASLRPKRSQDEFFPGFDDASCYPRLLEAVSAAEADGSRAPELADFAHGTAESMIAAILEGADRRHEASASGRTPRGG